METEGHPGLENLLARMDQRKLGSMNRKPSKSFHNLKIRNFDQKVKQPSGGQLKRVAFWQTL